MTILFVLVGFLIGLGVDGFGAGVLLSFIGFAVSALVKMERQLKAQGKLLDEHEQELGDLHTKLQEIGATAKADVSGPSGAETSPGEDKPDESTSDFKKEARDSARRVVQGLSDPSSAPKPVAKRVTQRVPVVARRDARIPQPPQNPNGVHAALARAADATSKGLREFFTGGNTVVRVGLLVLLVGVVLLLKYAAENSMFPIELRMASAAGIGMALIGIGYRKLESRPGFATTLQGGGVAILYMVVFFSFYKYDLVPGALAFALLACIAVFSGILAVLQNSLSMILIGITFGFLAPILANTGSGNHVALFGYYTVLNLLIVGVSWHRSWRPLNLLGFCFTFGIGTIWGVLNYEPEDFASTEPFLIGFFLMYVAIVAIFAWRRPAKLKGWVDGSLTFGVPLAVLALQYQLVKDMPFGMAFTAAGMAAVYIIVASVLFQRAPKAMRNLTEAFLVLGVGFATLAIPYGFSNHSLTGATWAVEGLGLFWLGIRQKRTISRVAGVVLQLLAGVALMVSMDNHRYPVEAMALLNSRFAAGFLMAASGYALAFLAYKHREKLHKLERFVGLLLPWSVVWWFGTCLFEIDRHVSYQYDQTVGILWFAATCVGYELLGRRLAWDKGRWPALLAVPGIYYLILIFGFGLKALNPIARHWHNPLAFELALWDNPLAYGGWYAWPVFVASLYFVLFRMPKDKPRALTAYHGAGHWGVTLFVALLAGHFVRSVDGLTGSWSVAAFGCALLAMFALTTRMPDRIQDLGLRSIYNRVVLGVLAIVLCLWHIRTSTLASGEGGGPLGYMPLANPLDVSLGLVFVSLWLWLRRNKSQFLPVLGPMAFLWFNGILARTAFHYHEATYGDVSSRLFRYEPTSLWNLSGLQVAYSVSWALIGLSTILLATRRCNRLLWQIGSGLLAVVVIKLFLVDLEELGSIQKIVTFLVVGVLLLVVGYFSPMPPSEASPKADTEPEVDPT